MGGISRGFNVLALTIASGEALSGVFDMTGHAGGMVLVPGAWDAANIGFQVSPTSDGTFNILRDESGTPVQISNVLTNGARWYAFPAEVFAARFVKLWSKSATAGTETDVNQTAARSLTVLLKG